MSEFTPTTEHVQRNYVGAEESYSVGTHRTRAARGAEFDRWLESVRAEAKAEERERIAAEIEAEFDRRSTVALGAAYQHNSGVLDGLDFAEQIARGITRQEHS